MAWGILFAALSMFGMFVMMVAVARSADEPPPTVDGYGFPDVSDMKKAA